MVRLLDHLATLGLRSNAAREALRTGKVKIHGVPTADAGRMIDPASVRYDPSSPRVVVGRDPAIVWFDPHLAVIWKPPGVLAVPAPGRAETDNVLRFAGQRLGRALPVHRLDEETSGLMIVARTPAAQDALKARLEAHAVERRYLALVRGHFPAGPEREVRSMMVRDRGDGLRGSLPADAPPYGAKLAVTFLALSELVDRFSLVEARLETGRTHQVRIHLAEGGHPVLGDPLYADRGVQRLAPRLALHAAQLAFTHPFTTAPLQFQAPLADDLEILRRRLLTGEPPERPARTHRRR
jgi:23S rRNA pseudouridine1911/1915/1917 synthase